VGAGGLEPLSRLLNELSTFVVHPQRAACSTSLSLPSCSWSLSSLSFAHNELTFAAALLVVVANGLCLCRAGLLQHS
jgi:hypothetical protein